MQATTTIKQQEPLTLAGLVYTLRKPTRSVENKKAVILLHGVGSNEKDLIRFADALPEDVYVIAPRGPFTLGPGRYAWYAVDFSSGKPVINKDQESQSRQWIYDFITDVKKEYGLTDVFLGGFSQGAIMSYTIGLLYPEIVSGILALSGRLLEEIKPFVRESEALQSLKVLITHGTKDQTLPVFYARSAKDYIESLGVRLTYQEFEGGHEINGQVLENIQAVLQ
jgi:phospholipase/carboxylesterase